MVTRFSFAYREQTNKNYLKVSFGYLSVLTMVLLTHAIRAHSDRNGVVALP
jgi:hypothetical protein